MRDPSSHASPSVAASAPASATSPQVGPHVRVIAARLDHTLLAPAAEDAAFARLCDEARRHHLFAVCVPPRAVALARTWLAGSDVRIACAIGFPDGAASAADKAREAARAVEQGAHEIDLLTRHALVRAREHRAFFDEVAAVVVAAHRPVKAILETGALDDAEKAAAVALAVAAGAAMVKTSSGFGPGGATEADVALLRKLCPPRVGVKASGGIRTLADARRMIAAGADRIGTSAGAAIALEEAAER